MHLWKRLGWCLLLVSLAVSTYLLSLPTRDQARTLRNSPHSMSLDEFEFLLLVLETKASLGSDSSLDLLLDTSQNIDGGYGISWAISMQHVARANPARFQRALSRKSQLIRHRVGLAVP